METLSLTNNMYDQRIRKGEGKGDLKRWKMCGLATSHFRKVWRSFRQNFRKVSPVKRPQNAGLFAHRAPTIRDKRGFRGLVVNGSSCSPVNCPQNAGLFAHDGGVARRVVHERQFAEEASGAQRVELLHALRFYRYER